MNTKLILITTLHSMTVAATWQPEYRSFSDNKGFIGLEGFV